MCDFGTFFHTKQRVFQSWKFCGLLLWTPILSFNPLHRFSTGFRSDDWLGHSSSFLSPFPETNGELPCVFGIIILLERPHSFHFNHPGRWQQISNQECLPTFFLSSFIQLYEVNQCCMLKNDPMIFPPPNVTVGMVFLGWYALPFDLWTLCIMASSDINRSLIWPDYILPVFYRLV